MQTGEGQLIPSLTLSCKGTDGSGNGSGRLHGYIPRGDFNPSLSPSTSNTLVHFGQTKENQTPCLFDTYNYCNYTNKYMDI